MRFGGLKQTQTDSVCLVRLITFEPKLSPLTMPVVKFRRNAGEKSLLKLLCRSRSVFRSGSKSKCWGGLESYWTLSGKVPCFEMRSAVQLGL